MTSRLGLLPSWYPHVDLPAPPAPWAPTLSMLKALQAPREGAPETPPARSSATAQGLRLKTQEPGGDSTRLQLTWEGVDVDDRVLPRLVVDDDVNPEERHAQRLAEGPGQLPDDLVAGPLEHTLDLVQLPTHTQVRPG